MSKVAHTTVSHAGTAPTNKDKEIEDQFYTNLLLLGIDRQATEKTTGVQISRHMFTGQGNSKGMEVVLHFLLCKISPSEAKQARRFIRLVSFRPLTPT